MCLTINLLGLSFWDDDIEDLNHLKVTQVVISWEIHQELVRCVHFHWIGLEGLL